jgi:hypothetical protein
MNSPLEKRKVRLRGRGGLAVCGVRSGCGRSGIPVDKRVMVVANRVDAVPSARWSE